MVRVRRILGPTTGALMKWTIVRRYHSLKLIHTPGPLVSLAKRYQFQLDPSSFASPITLLYPFVEPFKRVPTSTRYSLAPTKGTEGERANSTANNGLYITSATLRHVFFAPQIIAINIGIRNRSPIEKWLLSRTVPARELDRSLLKNVPFRRGEEQGLLCWMNVN